MDIAAKHGEDLRYYSIAKKQLNWFKWAGNSRLLISTGIKFSLPPLFYSAGGFGRLDVETGDVISLNEKSLLDRDSIIHIDPSGRYIVAYQYRARSSGPYAVRIDLATGSEVVVQKPQRGIDRWLADANGNIRAGIGYTTKKWRLYYRKSVADDFVKIESRRYSQMQDDVVDNIVFLPEEGKAIIVANSRTGRFGAYDYDIAEDIIGAPIFEHDIADVTDLIIGNDKRLLGVKYDAEKPGQKWLDAGLTKIQARLDKSLRGKENRILSFSDNRDTILFWSGAGADPGSYFIFKPAESRIEQLLVPFDKIDPGKLSRMKSVSYLARDGLTVSGYLTMPKYAGEKPLPAVILPHGGPFSRTSWGYDPWVQFLADRGYAVLQPNFRGSTGFGRNFVERGYGEWGAGMSNDIDDGTKWLISQGIADKDRICIMGASYGGYAALWGAIRSPDLYRCAASLNGVTDVRAMLKYDRRQFAARRYARRWKEKVAGQEKKDLAAISPVQQAARLKVPTLVMQGEKDDNVPKKQADDFLEAIEEAKVTGVEKLYFPNSGHDLSSGEDVLAFFKAIEKFLAKHNPTDRNSAATAN
ncbi:MAG: S9 family peptidase [Sphingorhabdus sp.]